MDTSDLITLTADIVSAHVSANSITPSDLPKVIQSVYAALEGLGQAAPVVEEKREPAVSVRSSVKPEAITCLDCGAKMKMLKRHLGTDHGLTPDEYRARWNLNSDYPMVAPDYAAKRRELAMTIGLGRKPGQGRKSKVVVAEAAPVEAPVMVEEAPAPKAKAGRPRKTAVKETAVA